MTTKAKKEKPKIQTKLPVYNFLEAKEIGTLDLNEKIFDGKINNALLHQVTVMYQANKRAGTASTKTRGEVRGGGKKPWKQKGTGRARASSIRSPLWKGGGAVFGPHPKDYSYSLPKKLKNIAIKSALNAKLKDNELFLIDGVRLEEPKTRIFIRAFKNFLIKLNPKIDLEKPRQMSAILVIEGQDINLKKASRNIPHVLVRDPNNITAFDAILYKNLIISKDAFEKVCNRILL